MKAFESDIMVMSLYKMLLSYSYLLFKHKIYNTPHQHHHSLFYILYSSVYRHTQRHTLTYIHAVFSLKKVFKSDSDA